VELVEFDAALTSSVIVCLKNDKISVPGLPDFLWYNIPLREKIYQNIKNLSNGQKIFLMAGNRQTSSSAGPKFTQIGIFGLKIYHLKNQS
jgi:hypothetical protein